MENGGYTKTLVGDQEKIGRGPMENSILNEIAEETRGAGYDQPFSAKALIFSAAIAIFITKSTPTNVSYK